MKVPRIQERDEAIVQSNALRQLNIRTVVLVGGGDFGRCPLGTRLPAALWPLPDGVVLLHLLNHLADEGITEAIVCCGRNVQTLVEGVCAGSRVRATVIVEEWLGGTAGCLRDATASDPGDLLLVLSASMMAPPAMADLVEAHRTSGAELTMVFNPGGENELSLGSPAEIYLCQPQVLRHIPSGGYSDIKEGLIPAILRSGGRVHPLRLDREVGDFRDRRSYLDALSLLCTSDPLPGRDSLVREESEGGPVLRGKDVSVHPAARVYGPAMLGDQVRVMEGAVVIGPTVIGRGVVLGANSVVVRSAVWADAAVGTTCEVRESIIGEHTHIPDRTTVVEQVRCAEGAGGWTVGGLLGSRRKHIRSSFDLLAEKLVAWTALSGRQLRYLAAGLLLGAAFLWSYWSTFADLMSVWRRSDEYSSGLLVPPLAAYVLWSRRRALAAVGLRPAVFWGVAAFLVAQGIRAEGLYRMYVSAERLSLVLALAAVALLVLGWRQLKKLAGVLLFLCLMLPWPARVQTAVTLPLQRWSTNSAVFCLELTGHEIEQDGNVIHIGKASVAVAEACNGLRMVTAFFVISGLVVLLTTGAWWEKLVVLVSSLPIALLCNTLRLAATALLFTMVTGAAWEKRFHDWGGYAMMPLALALVVGELWLLGRLTTPPLAPQTAVISRRPGRRVPDPQ